MHRGDCSEELAVRQRQRGCSTSLVRHQHGADVVAAAAAAADDDVVAVAAAAAAAAVVAVHLMPAGEFSCV